MNLLIVGENPINGALVQMVTNSGHQAVVVPDMNHVRRLKGQPGAFVAVTAQAEIEADRVVVTQPPAYDTLAVEGATAFRLFNPADIQALIGLGQKEMAHPIVFVLDTPEETPEHLASQALHGALALAKQGKKVLFLSMFVKTAAPGMEAVYLQARQAGVTFMKYENIDIMGDADTHHFTIKAFDGVFEMEVSTPYVVAAGAKDDTLLKGIIQKCRLTPHNKGAINGNKFFLTSALTSRKGIYYFHGTGQPGDATEAAETLWQHILTESTHDKAMQRENQSTASIDKDKCAFCYSCYRVCPHGALEPDIENNAMACVAVSCQGCGACAAICPGQAITMPEEANGEKAPNAPCKVFGCENSAYPALVASADALGDMYKQLDITPLPCGGRLGQDMVAAALPHYNKVLVAVCKEDACRHMVGDKRACQHVEQMLKTLSSMGVEGKKIGVVHTSHAMAQDLVEKVKAFLQDDGGDFLP